MSRLLQVRAPLPGEGDPWVLDRLREAKDAIDGAFPILPGLHIPDFYDRPDALRALIQAILKANPASFCLFSDSELRRLQSQHPTSSLL